MPAKNADHEQQQELQPENTARSVIQAQIDTINNDIQTKGSVTTNQVLDLNRLKVQLEREP